MWIVKSFIIIGGEKDKMTSRTISICQGKGSLGHNNRAFHTKNTNPDRTPNNIVFVREPIGVAYDKLFGIVKKSAVRKYPKSKIGRYQAA